MATILTKDLQALLDSCDKSQISKASLAGIQSLLENRPPEDKFELIELNPDIIHHKVWTLEDFKKYVVNELETIPEALREHLPACKDIDYMAVKSTHNYILDSLSEKTDHEWRLVQNAVSYEFDVYAKEFNRPLDEKISIKVIYPDGSIETVTGCLNNVTNAVTSIDADKILQTLTAAHTPADLAEFHVIKKENGKDILYPLYLKENVTPELVDKAQDKRHLYYLNQII